MKKKWLSCFIILCIFLTAFPGYSQATNTDFEILNGVLTKYNGIGGAVVVPDEVTSVGTDAFSQCTTITSVVLPEKVSSIGDSSFNGCTALLSITIPDGVNSIGDYAFANCSTLQNVTLPAALTSLGAAAFSSCSSLQSVSIPAGLTVIDSETFCDCKALQSVSLPEGITAIGDSAFAYCLSLKNITLPNSLTQIGYYSFGDCESLTDVVFSDQLESIGTCAFIFTAITDLNLPDSVTTIGDTAFGGCTQLVSVTLPDGVANIGSAAFGGCSSLSSAAIPVSVVTIGEEAFQDTSSDFTVYGQDGSTAETYAKANNLKFVSLDTGAVLVSPNDLLTAGTERGAFSHYTIFNYDNDEANDACKAGLIPPEIYTKEITAPITRADFCHYAVKLLEVAENQSTDEILANEGFSIAHDPFTDTDDLVVSVAAALGIVTGTGNGMFLPNGSITRAEAAAMLMRTAKVLGYQPDGTSASFSDLSNQADWAKTAVQFVSAAGIMNGTASGVFSPKQNYTYQQSCITMWRLLKALYVSGYATCPQTDGTLSDNGSILTLGDGAEVSVVSEAGDLKTTLTIDGVVTDAYSGTALDNNAYSPDYIDYTGSVGKCAYTARENRGNVLYFSSISGFYMYDYTATHLTRYADWSVGDFKIYGDRIYLISNRTDNSQWTDDFFANGCNELGYLSINSGEYTQIADLEPIAQLSENPSSTTAINSIDCVEADGSVSISSVYDWGGKSSMLYCYKVLGDGYVQVAGCASEYISFLPYEEVLDFLADIQTEVDEKLQQGETLAGA